MSYSGNRPRLRPRHWFINNNPLSPYLGTGAQVGKACGCTVPPSERRWSGSKGHSTESARRAAACLRGQPLTSLSSPSPPTRVSDSCLTVLQLQQDTEPSCPSCLSPGRGCWQAWVDLVFFSLFLQNANEATDKSRWDMGNKPV